MKQNYTIKNFSPSAQTLNIIRQFAHTYRPMFIDGKYIPFCAN